LGTNYFQKIIKSGASTMTKQKPKNATNLQNQLNSLGEKFRRTLPQEVYTRFETITLKFAATPDTKEMNFSGSGLWKDGDVKEVSYLDGIQMMTRQYPLNFSQVGRPKRARFGIGILLFQTPKLPISRFTEAHRRFCDTWLELETLAKSHSSVSPSFPSLSFCQYVPRQGDDPMREAEYKDWDHLRNEVIRSLEAIDRLRVLLKKNVASVSSEKQNPKSKPQAYAIRPSTKIRYGEMRRHIEEELKEQGKKDRPRDRFPLTAIFNKVSKKLGVSTRTIRRAWQG
jgi:hypothetical protein